jgi:uncharacterized membrane protein YfhO
MQFVRHLGDEYLLRVPGGGVATLERRNQQANSPSAHVVPVSYPNPSSISMHTSSRSATTLYLHVTNDPGWHLSVDGRSEPLHEWNGVMMKVQLSPGQHAVTLNYLPRSFEIGVALLGAAALALGGWILVEWVSARRR